MQTRWIGITGALLIIVSLALGAIGPRWFPNAYGGSNGAMSGMMGRNGAMSGMMSGGMMNGQIVSDPNRPFDQQFLDQMIMHHEGAVMSTQMMIAQSQRPELRDLAQRIITGQQRELDQMRQWRKAWFGAAPGGASADAMMSGGTMDQAQMRQMMGNNVDLDRMFLGMMIPHHQSAVSMAQQALKQTQRAEIKTLAQNIITVQRAEIAEMQRYLKDWYGVNS